MCLDGRGGLARGGRGGLRREEIERKMSSKGASADRSMEIRAGREVESGRSCHGNAERGQSRAYDASFPLLDLGNLVP